MISKISTDFLNFVKKIYVETANNPLLNPALATKIPLRTEQAGTSADGMPGLGVGKAAVPQRHMLGNDRIFLSIPQLWGNLLDILFPNSRRIAAQL